MKKEIDYKVPNGKLVRISADLELDRIKRIMISGDFFLHPEGKIELIENSLKGKKLERKELEDTIKKVVQKNGIQLLGVSVQDFVYAIMLIKSKK